MRNVEFTKDHVSGIKKGHKAKVHDSHARRLITSGHAKLQDGEDELPEVDEPEVLRKEAAEEEQADEAGTMGIKSRAQLKKQNKKEE